MYRIKLRGTVYDDAHTVCVKIVIVVGPRVMIYAENQRFFRMAECKVYVTDGFGSGPESLRRCSSSYSIYGARVLINAA